MGWVDELEGRVVGIDSAPLIYFLERHPIYRQRLVGFYNALSSGRLRGVTSAVTLAEVLPVPLRLGRTALVDEYREYLLDTAELETVDITAGLAEAAAGLRARFGLRTPDALQISTALSRGATHFLTNDLRLARVTDLRVLVLDQLSEQG